jgi:hypothetical protein
VEGYEIYVENSFQNRVIMSILLKAIPGAMAELSINLEAGLDRINIDNIEVDIGHWYLINGELVSAPDARVDNLP